MKCSLMAPLKNTAISPIQRERRRSFASPKSPQWRQEIAWLHFYYHLALHTRQDVNAFCNLLPLQNSASHLTQVSLLESYSLSLFLSLSLSLCIVECISASHHPQTSARPSLRPPPTMAAGCFIFRARLDQRIGKSVIINESGRISHPLAGISHQ